MSKRSHNFYAGPAVLPQEVLEQAQAEMTDYKSIGLSLMEISHRSPAYEEIHYETQLLFKELLQLPDEYHVLFLPGGASLQFSMIPMNFPLTARKPIISIPVFGLRKPLRKPVKLATFMSLILEKQPASAKCLHPKIYK